MSSQGGFMGYGSGGQDNGSALQNARRQRSYRTLTVKQALSASEEHPDGPTIIDQVPVDHAVICAIIREVKHVGSGLQLRLEDATGAFEVKKYVAGGDLGGAPEEAELEVGKYAFVHGFFRNFTGRRSFNVVRVDPNVAPYQILYHEVEALREHLNNTGKLEFGVKKESNGCSNGASNGSAGNGDQGLFLTDDNPLRQRIKRILDNHTEVEDGVSIEWLSKETANPEPIILKELLVMQAEGLAYSVDADDHWLPTLA